MKTSVARYFAEKDFLPPPGVTGRPIQYRISRTVGPYTIRMETACGREPHNQTGRVRIRLYDCRAANPSEPIATKRFQAGSCAEAVQEVYRLGIALHS